MNEQPALESPEGVDRRTALQMMIALGGVAAGLPAAAAGGLPL